MRQSRRHHAFTGTVDYQTHQAELGGSAMGIRAYAVAIAFAAIAEMGQAQTFHPDIPRAWDDAEVARFEMPLARRDRSSLP